MVVRDIEHCARFGKDLARLEKKHRGIRESVESFFRRRAKGIPVSGEDRIPGLGGEPVYKARIALPGIGKRSGARLIYYRDAYRIVALRVYQKSKTVDMPLSDIKKALSEAGI